MESSEITWPFPDPPDTEVITLKRILSRETPLRLVSHDEDDGSWQFLDGEHLFEDDAALMTLDEVTRFDFSLFDLSDLPNGWYAWRTQPDQPWQRAQGEPPEDLLPPLEF
jgi:hypothetical protein